MNLRGRFPALDIAFSPDGRTLAAGERYEKRITLWDLQTSPSRSILQDSSVAIFSVAFSPDGSLLAAACSVDRLVRAWDTSSGGLRFRAAGQAGGTNVVRFSPDGGLLITSGSDGMVRIWKAETGEPIVGRDGRPMLLPKLFLSADRRTVAAVGWDNDARVWDVDVIDGVPSHRSAK
jgi:WD40 repeat protein